MATHSIFRHIRNYTSGGLLAALAGLVTFPILTRSLSVEDYGLIGLITGTLTMFVAVGKLGIQHSIIRYFVQIRAGDGGFDRYQLTSTTLLTALLTGLASVAVWVLASAWVLPAFMQTDGLMPMFAVAGLLLLLRLLVSMPINFLRADQRSARAASYQIIQRYAQLLFILALLLTGRVSLLNVLIALVVSELIACSLIFFAARDLIDWRPGSFSGPLVRSLLVYGFPLMVLETVGQVLRLADRYIIESVHGADALGQYAASYNLSAYLQIIIASGVVQAVRPMYTQLWETEGEAATQRFLADGFRYFAAFGLPLITIFSCVAPDLLTFLAGDKYRQGTLIIPLISFSLLIEGALMFVAAGLYLSRRTTLLMYCGLAAVALNIVLNLLMVPVFGLLGAAAVTVVSYLVFGISSGYLAFRVVSFDVRTAELTKLVVASVVIYLAVARLDVGFPLLNIVVKGSASTLLSLLLLYFIDRQIVDTLIGQLRTRLPMAAGGAR